MPLPQLDLLYEGGARCEKPPLPSSVAAGIAPPRIEPAAPAAPMLAQGDAFAMLSPELMAQDQAPSLPSSGGGMLGEVARSGYPAAPDASSNEQDQFGGLMDLMAT